MERKSGFVKVATGIIISVLLGVVLAGIGVVVIVIVEKALSKVTMMALPMAVISAGMVVGLVMWWILPREANPG